MKTIHFKNEETLEISQSVFDRIVDVISEKEMVEIISFYEEDKNSLFIRLNEIVFIS